MFCSIFHRPKFALTLVNLPTLTKMSMNPAAVKTQASPDRPRCA